jgi:hypothetical protein
MTLYVDLRTNLALNIKLELEIFIQSRTAMTQSWIGFFDKLDALLDRFTPKHYRTSEMPSRIWVSCSWL